MMNLLRNFQRSYMRFWSWNYNCHQMKESILFFPAVPGNALHSTTITIKILLEFTINFIYGKFNLDFFILFIFIAVHIPITDHIV
jgi:hypothetical protein